MVFIFLLMSATGLIFIEPTILKKVRAVKSMLESNNENF